MVPTGLLRVGALDAESESNGEVRLHLRSHSIWREGDVLCGDLSEGPGTRLLRLPDCLPRLVAVPEIEHSALCRVASNFTD